VPRAQVNEVREEEGERERERERERIFAYITVGTKESHSCE